MRLVILTAVLLSCTCCYGQKARSDVSSVESSPVSVEETDVVFHNGDVRLAGTLVFPKTDAPTPARNEPWFQYVYLPNGGQLPRDTASSKWAQEMDYNLLPFLEDVSAPMLFLFGALDQWVPVQASIDKIGAATASKKDVTILTIEDADHYLMIADPTKEDPQNRRISPDYLRVLQEWLQKHGGL